MKGRWNNIFSLQNTMKWDFIISTWGYNLDINIWHNHFSVSAVSKMFPEIHQRFFYFFFHHRVLNLIVIKMVTTDRLSFCHQTKTKAMPLFQAVITVTMERLVCVLFRAQYTVRCGPEFVIPRIWMNLRHGQSLWAQKGHPKDTNAKWFIFPGHHTTSLFDKGTKTQ